MSVVTPQVEEVDEDFEKELAALMTDFKLPPSGPFPQAVASDTAVTGSSQEGAGTVSFRVMMKRGGRDDRSKAVQVITISMNNSQHKQQSADIVPAAQLACLMYHMRLYKACDYMQEV